MSGTANGARLDAAHEAGGRRFAGDPLRIGFVPVIRPLFKGDAPAAAERSLRGLRTFGEDAGYTVVTAGVGSDTVHQATGRVVPSCAVTDAAEAARAAAELVDAELDLLLIQHTTFATGDLLAPLVNAHPRVALWALPESAGGRGAEGPLPLNALCGLNMTLSLLGAPEVTKAEPVKWLYGETDDAWFRERFLPTLGALRGLRALDGARILQIGGTAPAFWGLQESPSGLPRVAVETQPLEALFDAVRAVSDAAAEARAERWRQEEHDAPDDHLVRGARIELGLAALAEEARADAIAVRCWPELPDACGAMACAAMGNSAEHGVPAACEGDVMGALSMLALQGVTGRSAILMDLSDLDRQEDRVLVWHCGNAPAQWAGGERRARLTTHFNRDGVGVVRDMTLRPGPVTGFRLLAGGGGGWILSGDVADTDAPSFDGVRGWIGDLRWNGASVRARDAVTGLLDRRLPHHLAFGMGDVTPALQELCGWLGARLLPAPTDGPMGPR